MTTVKNLFLSSLVVLAAAAQADLLTLTDGSQAKSGVNISTGAVASINGLAIPLTTVGSGLRRKVVVFKLEVYVAQLMVDDASRFVKTEADALASLDKVGTVALRMTFVRDVPATKMATAFQDGFNANAINSKSTELTEFLAKVGQAGDAKAGGSLTLLITRNADGTTAVAYENLKNGTSTIQTLVGTQNTMHEIMAIWLGKPSDKELGELKAEMLK